MDDVKPVKKNANGLTILCYPDEAEGYVGSDNETVYPRLGLQFQPSYYEVAQTLWIENIPTAVVPLAWKYDADNGFYMNEDPYPDTNRGLTVRASDLEDIVLEMSEIIYA